MRGVRCVEALVVTLCWASPAAAQEAAPEPFTAGDHAMAAGTGLLGGALGGLALTFAWVLASDDFDGVFGGILGGLLLGTSSGVYWYGQATDHEGSFSETLVGAGVGVVVSFAALIYVIQADSSDALSWIVLSGGVLAPPIGATLGYAWSLDEATPPRGATASGRPKVGASRGHGALLDYHPAAGLRLSVPQVAVGLHDGFQLAVPVLGGQF